MPRLIPVDAHGTSTFVEALQQAWAKGDAVLPIDPRLPRPARQRLLDAAGLDSPVADGDALVVATSGSTGEPKLAVLTHDAVMASATATSARLSVDPSADRWLACLPLAHVGGLGVVTRALLTGTPLTVHDGFDAEAVRAAAAGGCTLVSLVPTALRRTDTSGFRVVLVGGSASGGELPANSVTTYGMTETAGGVVYDGRPLDGVDVRIVDGEIHLRTPTALRCYRDGSDPKIHGGWLPTGDGGELRDGRLVVHGRLADVIVTGGEKVWPAAVAEVLVRHPAVADVIVRGEPDADWGARVVAIVVPADLASPPSLDELRGFVKEHLAPYAAPRELELVAVIDRTALGKTRRASP